MSLTIAQNATGNCSCDRAEWIKKLAEYAVSSGFEGKEQMPEPGRNTGKIVLQRKP
jgi:hypothetical protein